MIYAFDNDIGYMFIAGCAMVYGLAKLWFNYKLRRLYAETPDETMPTTVVIPEEPGHPMTPPETPA